MSRDTFRRVLNGSVLLAAALLAGCTAQPLYSAQPKTTPAATEEAMSAEGVRSMSMQSALSSVAIKPVETRVGQMTRNQLIFLFGQGAGEPRSPAYTMDLTIAQGGEGVAAVQLRGFVNEDQPSAQRLTLTGTYALTDQDGTVIGSGSRQAIASLDVPRQGFASRAARIDAEDRAARELAEMLHLAVAQALAAR